MRVGRTAGDEKRESGWEEKAKKHQDEDTDGHMLWSRVSPEGTEEDSEGQAKRSVSPEGTEEEDTEARA